VSRNLRVIGFALLGVVAVLVVVRLVRGEGDDSSSTTTTVSAAAAWADGACSAFSAWKADLHTAAAEIRANPTKGGLEKGLDKAQTATKSMGETLSSLDTPSTEAAGQAKDTLQTLKSQLQDNAAVIRSTIDGLSGAKGSVEATSTISTTLVTMRDQLKLAAETLRSLPKGELEQAVSSSSACQTLKSSNTTAL
jgi:hypothetical protein